MIAGKDATAAFFGLHRQEVLYTPRYAKYKIGQVEGMEQKVMRNESGSLSTVSLASPGAVTLASSPPRPVDG